MTDVEEAADLLMEGLSVDEVRALLPHVDPTSKEVVDLAKWKRDASGGARRVNADYLIVRLMALIDDETDKCEKCGRTGKLDANARARVLSTLARLRGKGRG